jgi:hypothetical protein
MPIARKDRASTTAQSYRQILVASRRRQLEVTRESIGRLQRTFDAAAESIAGQIANIPALHLTDGGAIQQTYAAQLLRSIDAILVNLQSDYGQLLNGGMHESAQAAADREALIEGLSGISAAKDPRLTADLTRLYPLTDGTTLTVRFGHVAAGAVNRAASRYYRDGLKLSDRLYNLDQAARKVVEDTILQGLTEQIGAKPLSERMVGALTAAGADNPRYQAMRIARTEINQAHREAHIQSTLDPITGRLKGFISAVGFRLSLGHPKPDICDVWAGADSGLGPGNYMPDDVPIDHSNGLCYTVSVLVEHPDVAAPSKAPTMDDVPASQVRYYAETMQDPVAQRRLAELATQAEAEG